MGRPIENNTVKSIILAVVIIGLLISNGITLKLYFESLNSGKTDEKELIDNTGDELSRAKFFIKDWYDEIHEIYGASKVYHNELRFCEDKYTLTVAGHRIRAVYPRGVRFFQMDYITYIEFFEDNGNLQCRMYYNETGEIVFRLN